MEIWKDIEGYLGYYKISNHGRVKQLVRVIITKDAKPKLKIISERIMNQMQAGKGYQAIKLTKPFNTRKSFYIHRLVVTHFLDNAEIKSQVNHIDGDKTNNHISNLEWVTPLENIRHAHQTGLMRPRGKAKLK